MSETGVNQKKCNGWWASWRIWVVFSFLTRKKKRRRWKSYKNTGGRANLQHLGLLIVHFLITPHWQLHFLTNLDDDTPEVGRLTILNTMLSYSILITVNWWGVNGRLLLANSNLGKITLDNVLTLSEHVLNQYRRYYEWGCVFISEYKDENLYPRETD